MSGEFEQAILFFMYPGRRYRRLLVLAVVVVVGLFLVSSVFYSIGPEEEGVLLRFGRHVASTEPGLHNKFPWPIDQVYPVPVQRVIPLEFGFRTLEAGRKTRYANPTREDQMIAEMLSGDLNLAHVEWIVQYRISDAFKFLFRLGGEPRQADAVENTIRAAAETVVRRLVGDGSVDEVLTFGRDRIAGDAKKQLQAMLDGFDCGVAIVAVKLQSVAPPEQVKDAFDSVNRARQNKERVINEAKGQRNELVPRARGERDRAVLEAEGYRELVVRAAQGRATAFLAQLAEYQKAPEVTRMRLYLEAMEELLGRVDEKLIIDESVRGLVPLLDLSPDRSAPVAGKGGRP
ncbi:MAG: FtsH protease activity modulator HflK [bacterium]|nr:FtsH protease activity modulator HflK [bacterium]